MATVRSASNSRVLALAVLTNDHPVQITRLAIPQGRGYSGQHAGWPHVRVLIEALADFKTQAPQRDVIRYIGRTHGAEENGVERFKRLQSVRRHHDSVLLVVVRAPVELFKAQADAGKAFLKGAKDLDCCFSHFDPDAVRRNRCNGILSNTHIRSRFR